LLICDDPIYQFRPSAQDDQLVVLSVNLDFLRAVPLPHCGCVEFGILRESRFIEVCGLPQKGVDDSSS
jgi:hypothetical protein